MAHVEAQALPQASPSAPGTQACQNCRISKAKCVREGNHPKCERCSRLHKDCVPVARVQRKKRAPHITCVHGSPSLSYEDCSMTDARSRRTAQLEQKLEGLVELLAAQQNATQQQTTPSTDTSNPPQIFTPAASSYAADPVPTYSPARISGDPAVWYGGRPASRPPQVEILPQVELAEGESAFDNISAAEAASLLNIFQTRFAPQMPFVVVPLGTTPEQLQRDKPFLFRNILLIASHTNPHRQVQMGVEIMKDLGSIMFIKFQKDLALLQGLLVCAAWNHFHGNQNVQGINLASLSLSLVYTLDLQKPLPPVDRPDPYDNLMRKMHGSSIPPKKEQHTLEEQRAFLGCFYCCSVVSVCFKKMEGMRITPYVEICCQNLLAAREYESDYELVNMIRLQCISETMNLTALTQAFPERGLTSNIISRTFLKELDAFGAANSRSIERSLWLATAYHRAYVQLNEPALHKPVILSAGVQTMEHLDMLYACLNSTKVFFDTFLTIPGQNYTYMTIFNYAHMAYGLATLFRLTLLETSGWDVAQVRSTIDIMDVTEKIVHNLEVAATILDPTGSVAGTDASTRVAKMIRHLRSHLETKLGVGTGDELQQQQMPQQSFEEGLGVPGFGLEGMDIFDAVDESFWQNFMVL